MGHVLPRNLQILNETSKLDVVFRFKFNVSSLVRKIKLYYKKLRLHNFTRNDMIWHFRGVILSVKFDTYYSNL